MDNVLVNKAATIERCIRRIETEYTAAGEAFETDFSQHLQAMVGFRNIAVHDY